MLSPFHVAAISNVFVSSGTATIPKDVASYPFQDHSNLPTCQGILTCGLLKQSDLWLQMNGAVRPIVRKKCSLCLLRLMRKSPSDVELLQPEVWSVKLVRHLSLPAETCCIWPDTKVLCCICIMHGSMPPSLLMLWGPCEVTHQQYQHMTCAPSTSPWRLTRAGSASAGTSGGPADLTLLAAASAVSQITSLQSALFPALPSHKSG